MSAYGGFAAFYDALMSDVDYARLADFVLEEASRVGHSPKLLLDAACGTGSLALELSNRGLEVVGVDCSEDMLSIAREKLKGQDVLLLCQDLCELDLYGTVDTAICSLDGLNHITDKRLLKRALRRISLFLEPGGLFLFDVNTPYKHREVLAQNTFVLEQDGIFAVWRNISGEKGLVEISLDLFGEQDGLYHRASEVFCERAYSEDEWRSLLAQAGFSILRRVDFDTLAAPRTRSEKIIYVARKVE